VQSFITDATLERLNGTAWDLADSDPGPGSLPGVGSGTWRLNQEPCSPADPLGGLSCCATAGRAMPVHDMHGGDQAWVEFPGSGVSCST
jgi:hypothetical protein